MKRVSTHTGFTLNYYKVFQETSALLCQHGGVLVTRIQSPRPLQSGRLGLREAKQFPGGLGVTESYNKQSSSAGYGTFLIRATAFYFLMPSNQVQALCQRKEGQLPEKGSFKGN